MNRALNNTVNGRFAGKFFPLAKVSLVACGVFSTAALSLSAPKSVSIHAPGKTSGVAQRAAAPGANTVRLSQSQNVQSNTGCLVTAWVGYVSPSGVDSPRPGNTVKFYNGNILKGQRISNANGETPPFPVSWNTVTHGKLGAITSNPFSCGNNPNHDPHE